MVRVGATFSLWPDLVVRLNELAQRERTSVSSLVERAIQEYLERYERERARGRSGRQVTVTASDQEGA